MEAMLYEKAVEKAVLCHLCAHECRINPGHVGICGVRENKDGTLYTLVDNRIVAENVDPIEKKPLFHFLPGTMSYSIATVGCNFRCTFCQNADISQMPRDRGIIAGKPTSPEAIVEAALKTSCRSISYTYTEPTVFFELCYLTARVAKDKGLANVFVTNGYMTTQALETIHPYLSAANVDLKSFREDFYRKYCGAKLKPVLTAIEKMKSLGIWIEITTLIIPGLNDSETELYDIARFIRALGDDIPWHVSRFYPRYKLTDLLPTPPETVYRARNIGQEVGLKYVYCGNLPGDEGEYTYCPNCQKPIIERWGFQVTRYFLKKGRCQFCGATISGVFS
ncbi:MAG TPA: AmmeMemoRadiSam system radical SAM enzyme [Syntrophales bacterium]|nr:AmmeMemoRadiSam system radical SAM enzyme [Syntrophales bacterium]HOL59553.1 AmmeMemoRadiSam system radical SAM enzyme [Syntrophales bacterium]HPO35643.1 AmmeMemoRadiSam system radical SAM enzyme [Syntrophales bacterium]